MPIEDFQTSLSFDDFRPGQQFRGSARTITEAEIISFAHHWDPQDMHIDAVWAQEGPFGGLIASGFHTLSLAWWLFLRLGLVKETMYVGIGIDELRWLKPVRPGDTLSLTVEILETHPTSRPDRGKVAFGHLLTNQHGEVVMTYRTLNLINRRPAGE